MPLRHGSLFSGMGGFDLAARWMGWDNIFHCEKDPFAQKILKHHFPESISYHDIKETDFKIHSNTIDILSGGFPCQPFSMAGKRKGTEDDRHLWPWMLGAIRDVKPRWVVGENVLGLVNWSGGLVFEEVQSDLEAEGYQVQTFILPACAVDAPHRRDRCWIVAYNNNARIDPSGSRVDRNWSPEGDQWQQSQFKSSGSCSDGIDTDTGLLGPQKPEQQTVGSEQLSKSGATADTKGVGNRGILPRMEEEDGSVRESKEHRENDLQSRNNGKERSVTNASSIGGIQQREGRSIRDTDGNDKNEESGRDEFPNGFGGSLEREILSDTENIGRQSTRSTWERRSGSEDSRLAREYWENWPTQSPLCNGNDGVPARLDAGAVFNKPCKPTHARTFAKWRNESIKCGGNAVVPQVPYQIFNAIQEYENMVNQS